MGSVLSLFPSKTISCLPEYRSNQRCKCRAYRPGSKQRWKTIFGLEILRYKRFFQLLPVWAHRQLGRIRSIVKFQEMSISLPHRPRVPFGVDTRSRHARLAPAKLQSAGHLVARLNKNSVKKIQKKVTFDSWCGAWWVEIGCWFFKNFDCSITPLRKEIHVPV